MKQYHLFKDSGIDWFDKIPTHWETHIKLQSLATNKRGSFTNGPFGSDLLTSEIMDKGVPIIYIRDIAKGTYYWKSKAFVTEQKAKNLDICSVEPGDLLVAKVGDPPGISAIYPPNEPKAIITQDAIRIKLNKKKVDGRFLSFLLNTTFGQALIEQVTVESTRSRISLGDFKRITFFLPLINEQCEIANFLDNKSQIIDKKISLLQKKIGYYKELRKSLINETVTKGLDKNVKLKDSKIDWIGQIPEHWEVKRVKDHLDLFTGNSISDKSKFESPVDSFPYVATKDIDFHTGKIKYNNGIYIPKGDKSFKKAKINTTLICIEGANAGKKIGFTKKEVAFVNKLCAIKSKSKSSFDHYFYYFTQTNLFNSQFFAIINGLIGGVSINLIKNFNILVPSKKEQIEISQYLSEKLLKIDQIILNIQTQVTTLKELRKTLINDVVTGKIRVAEEKEKELLSL